MAAQRPTLPTGLSIERAETQDIPAIQSITHSAYEKYIPRIGKPPAPMKADWPTLLRTHQVSVLRAESQCEACKKVLGAIVLGIEDNQDSIKVNNLVVDQAAQGRGYGKLLMSFAEDEARDRGRKALALFTNVLMYENLVLYPKLGFVETERREEDGYDRVYYRKEL
jgi:GNAT superfamily N-acetyltransferase